MSTYHSINAEVFNELSQFIAERRATMGQKANSPLVDSFPDFMPSTIPTINLTRQQFEWHQDNYALLLTFISVITNTPIDKINVNSLISYVEGQNDRVLSVVAALDSYKAEVRKMRFQIEL